MIKSSAQLKNDIKGRARTLKLLDQFASQCLSEAAEQWNAAMIELQTNKLQRFWATFEDFTIRIASAKGVADRMLSQNDQEAMSASETYSEAKLRLEALLRKCDPGRFRSKPKVSEIMLDKFNGSYTKWIAWRCAFESKVLDTQLGADVKLDLLLSSLEGGARLCAGDPEHRDEDELNRIWKKLNDAYDNPYQIVSTHINNILDLPQMTYADSQKYQNMLNVCDQELRALRRFDYAVESWSPLIAVILIRKLDRNTRVRWEMDREPSQPPSLSEITDYLTRRIHAYDNSTTVHSQNNREPQHLNNKRYVQSPATDRPFKQARISDGLSKTTEAAAPSKPAVLDRIPNQGCWHCKGQHQIFRCERLARLDLAQRIARINELKLCQVCLSKEHATNSCQWTGCGNCNNARHNRLLCPKTPIMRSFLATERKRTRKMSNRQNFSTKADQNVEDDMQIIGTAQFKLDVGGGMLTGNIRALCDSGSQVNLITEDCVQRWCLQKTALKVPIVGVGIGAPIVTNGSVEAFLMNHANNALRIPIRFMVVSKISDHNPQRRFQCTLPAQLTEKDLADPTFNHPGPVDALLGVGIWTEIVEEGLLKFSHEGNCFIAHKSLLGWVIAGYTRQVSLGTSLAFHTSQADKNFDAQLERFWNVEDQSQSRQLTPDEQAAMENFAATHFRDEEGRYVVTIPFREETSTLGSSRNTALNRFLALERRLAKPDNADLAVKYKEFMEDYVNVGHLVVAPPAPRQCNLSYYIPFHIINTKKFRVVFDASCSSSSGVSLNDLQLPGPKLQPDLACTMLLFRTYRYALTADIVKMYRQVKVHPDHHNYQRIFYRPSDNEPIGEYIITCVIWGFTSATFNAVRALQQCGSDEGSRFPAAAEAIMKNFYMDDLLWGGDEEQEIRQNQQEISEVLRRGGFELSKWASNSVRVATELNQAKSELALQDGPGILGVTWDTCSDLFHIKVQKIADSCGKLTKRQIISSVAQVYDPTGCFLPIIVRGKMIIQDIWKLSIGWDERVPDSIQRPFTEFIADVVKLAEVPVPRWLGTRKGSNIQLHLFSDASERAYGTCAYVRVTTEGVTTVRLVTARNKVAPVKTQSVPRLELMGAHMSVQLAEFVTEACAFTTVETFFWTDSTIVLHWLRKEAALLKPFVANRVAAISKSTQNNQWHHVPGHDNPADFVSRGCTVESLKTAHIWWQGPEWLKLDREFWPTMPQTLTHDDRKIDQRESKPNPLVVCTIFTNDLSLAVWRDYPDPPYRRPESIDLPVSTLNRLIRVTAFVFRFIRNCKLKRKKTSRRFKKFKDVPAIQNEEREQALMYWVKQTQTQSFFAEGEALREGRELPKASKLVALHPFIDARGIIRVGGRLGQSNLPVETKHQIVLNPFTPLATLIIKDAHNRVLHGGTQLTMGFIRQRFWMVRLREAVKKVINVCVTCIRFKREQAQQLMGSLPAARTNQALPFLTAGVDFAGPFQIRKTVAPRMTLRSVKKSSTEATKATVKCWVVVFVCMVTRAVHIDVAYGLNVEAFMEVFARFVSRRGQCRELWSDNGTNFVGTNKELQRVFREWAHKIPDKELANYGTAWRFITPGSPHQGGIWEASVKAMKFHLRRVMGRRILSGNQLYTIVTQIEGCLNSRPIAPLTDDPSDLEVLTPAHLLIGRPVTFIPMADDVASCNDNKLTLWGQQQKIYQLFWRRWKEDYLLNLQKRSKWQRAIQNIAVGDMVIVMADNTPPSFWPIGRVKSVYAGRDGLVRNVNVSTAAGERLRPIQKLCLLPMEASNDQ